MNENTPDNAAATAVDSTTKPLGDVIAINEGLIKDHLNKVVITTVEETHFYDTIGIYLEQFRF